MRRRLFLHAGSAATVVALTGCGGGGGGVADAGADAAIGPAADASGSPAVEQRSPAPAPAANKALPAQILGCYYTTWDTGRFKITDVPLEFNVIYLFHAKPNGAAVNGSHNNVGDGSFYFEHYDNVSPQDIQACRNRGQSVILTVGGAHAGYAWDNRTKSRNFIESVKTMYARLGGFDGIDFNNYEATIVNPSNVDAVTTEMTWIAGELKSLYGADFAITSPPQPNDPLQQQMMATMAKAGVLDYAGPQYYDWTGFNDAGFIKTRTDTWVKVLGDPQKVVVGLGASYHNGPSLQDCIREWTAIRATHPNIRGMFCWSLQTNMGGGNQWAREMKARL